MNKLKKIERLNIENGKHLTVEMHTVESEHPLHWHSFFEIEIVLSGEGKYVVNDIEYDIEEHNMFFLTSTDFHYLKVNKETKLINISFDENAIDESDIWPFVSLKSKKAYRFDEDEYQRLVKASELLKYECEIDESSQLLLLRYILKCVLRKNPITNMSANDDTARGIRKALVYMSIHFKEELTLKEIAREAGYNPTYFSELFKNVTGETYIEALTKHRIAYASQLLANGISVFDSCFFSGFNSLSNFYTAFKKKTGMSPSEYRAKHSSR